MSYEKEPPWLSAKVDQRLALMKDKMGKAGEQRLKDEEYQLVLTTLTEPREGATPEEIERWELTCDNCGGYFPQLWSGSVTRDWGGIQVVISFGACSRCAGKEE